MRITRNLEFMTGSKEEKLPYRTLDFPYTASQAELDYYRERFVPWHWHRAIELFYIESGEIQYCTPHKTAVFPAGTAGMVDSNVLHMTKIRSHREKNIQLIHIFDPKLLAGGQGSLIEQKYITPLITAPQIEILALYPDQPEQSALIDSIRGAFLLAERDFGYEINIREALSKIWVQLCKISFALLQDNPQRENRTADKVKQMMVYVHEHYTEKISIPELAGCVFLSERECYRAFQNCLHMTPAEYIKSYRLQMACQILADSQMPITEAGYACGLGNASYFGKVFREFAGCTPLQYRRRWQNCDKT